jgi:hypothetical protein
MSAGTQRVLDMVAQRLHSEPNRVLPTLRLLIDADSLVQVDDDRTLELARTLNTQRLAELRAAFQTRALTTAQVMGVLGVSRQALSARVGHRRLLAVEIGGTLRFPDWQFGLDGLVSGVDKVVPELLEGRRGVLAADAIMRTPLEDEAGRSPARLLADGQLELCLHYVRTAGAGL